MRPVGFGRAVEPCLQITWQGVVASAGASGLFLPALTDLSRSSDNPTFVAAQSPHVQSCFRFFRKAWQAWCTGTCLSSLLDAYQAQLESCHPGAFSAQSARQAAFMRAAPLPAFSISCMTSSAVTETLHDLFQEPAANVSRIPEDEQDAAHRRCIDIQGQPYRSSC